MQLRTFRGKTMAEALMLVKRELGPDAMIVHTRAFKVGGMLGVGAKEEVEILASAGPARTAPIPPLTRPVRTAGVPHAPDRVRAAYEQCAGPALQPNEKTSARPAPRPQAPAVAEPRLRLASQVGAAPHVTETTVRRAAQMVVDAPSPSHSIDLHEEVGAIKQMVASLLSSGAVGRPLAGAGVAAAAGGPDPLEAWYLKLLASAVSRELAERIIADVRKQVGSVSGGVDEERIRAAFRACIAGRLPTAREPLRLPRGAEPRPRTLAVVGATGVGKTTTIAKLAAQARLEGNARVALISCDTHRIGAIEQLRTYADIVGVPFRMASTPTEMRVAREAFAGMDLLLIDTPGLSPKDAAGIAALGEMLDAADAQEVHLALPASGNESALLGVARAFTPLRPSRLLFTKLDEAVTYGVILSVASEVKAELSYVTTGPRIPEQIEAPDAARFADLIAAAA